MDTFQIGQKVRCINATNKADNSPLSLVEGSIYTVSGMSESLLQIAEDPTRCYWKQSRFVPIEETNDGDYL